MKRKLFAAFLNVHVLRNLKALSTRFACVGDGKFPFFTHVNGEDKSSWAGKIFTSEENWQ